jgi:hypothetical protein
LRELLTPGSFATDAQVYAIHYPVATLWSTPLHYWFVHLGVTAELKTWDAFKRR